MDTLSSSSSSSSSDEEDEFIRQMFVAMMRVSDDGVDAPAGVDRTMAEGGRGTGRPNRKRPRKFNEAGATPIQQRRRDHDRAPWAERYFNAPLNPGSLAFDSFRQKFRVPYPMFMWILREARASRKFPDELVTKVGRVPAPLALQVAASFRYLATGCHVDANEEGSVLGRSTMSGFHHEFFEWFVQRFYEEFVSSKIPTDAAGLARLMKPFAMCGMPGAVRSRDEVHIATDRAKSQQRHLMTGKEGYPTWGYDCTVTHNRQFLEVHGPFRGNTNDKTMVRDSKFVTKLRDDPLFCAHEYNLSTGLPPPNDYIVMKGVHGINDGGYQRWPTTIAGPKPDDAPTVVLGQYGKHSESMRKDSECSFGIVKKRERILRLPLLIMKRSKVDNIVRTCIALHNMLLQFDGLDTIGEFDDDYIDLNAVDEVPTQDTNTGEMPSDEWLEADIRASDVRLNYTWEEQLVNHRFLTPVTITTDTMSAAYGEQDTTHESEVHPDYDEKLLALAVNLDCMFLERRVRWLKKAVDCRPVERRPPLGCPGPWNTTPAPGQASTPAPTPPGGTAAPAPAAATTTSAEPAPTPAAARTA